MIGHKYKKCNCLHKVVIIAKDNTQGAQIKAVHQQI